MPAIAHNMYINDLHVHGLGFIGFPCSFPENTHNEIQIYVCLGQAATIALTEGYYMHVLIAIQNFIKIY